MKFINGDDRGPKVQSLVFEVLFRERDSEWCEDCPEANSSVFAVGVILAVGAEISDNDVISDCFVSDLPMDD